MRKFSLLIMLLFSAAFSYAQNTATLSGVLHDTDSQAWISATWTAIAFSPQGSPHFLDGSKVPPYSGTLDTSGTFSGSIGRTSQMVPTGTTYTVTICSLTSATSCTIVPNVQVIGTTFNAGATLSPVPAPRIQAAVSNYAYNTTELINPVNGTGYINTVSGSCFLFQGSAYSSCGGSTGSSFYQTIWNNTTPQTQRAIIEANHTSGITASDDAGNNATKITLETATDSQQGGVKCATGTNCSTLSVVAATGQYNDILNKPVAPTFINRGLIALYLLNEGTGATLLHDSSGVNFCSGSPCNITLSGSTAPSMTTLGLDMKSVSAIGGGNQYFVTLPSQIANFTSATFGEYLPSPANGVFEVPTNWSSNSASDINNYFSLISAAANRFIMEGGNSHGFAYQPYMQTTGTPVTQAVGSFVGANSWTFTYGTNAGSDPDHIYLNSGEASYVAQGASTTTPTGPFSLGNIQNLYPTYHTGFPGTITCLAIYSVELTAAESLQNNSVCNQTMVSRGISTTVQTNPNLNNQIACTGDSIYSDIGGTTPVCNSMTGLSNTYTLNANGLPGWTCGQIQSLVPFREAYIFSSYTGQSIAFSECGNNDAQIGFTNQQVSDANVSLSKALVSAGAKQIFMTTLMSSTSQGTSDTTLKDILNPMLRQDAQMNGWGLVDYGTIPQLGCDNCATNTTYFLDGIHPTTAGKALMVAAMDNAVNELNGSTLQGGCPNTATTTTYAEQAADGCLRGDTTSNAVAITLPSCSGYFRPRIIQYVSGSNSLTVKAFSGENIDGNTGTIPINVNGTFTAYPRAIDSSGTCYWTTASNSASFASAQTDITGSSAYATPVQNTTGTTITITGYGTSSATGQASVACLTGPTSTPTTNNFSSTLHALAAGETVPFYCTVPPGYYYELTQSGFVTASPVSVIRTTVP